MTRLGLVSAPSLLTGPGVLPFGVGLGSSTVAAVAPGDTTITIHGTAGWIYTPAGTREIPLLLIDSTTGNWEIVLPLMGFITHAAGDQVIPILRAGNLPPGELAQTQTAKAYNAGAAVYQMFTPGLMDQLSSGSELDMATWNVATTVTVNTGTHVADSLTVAPQVQNSALNPTFSGLDPMILEGVVYLFLGGTIAANSRGVISICDITAGPPGAGAIELGQAITPQGSASGAIITLPIMIPLGTPPAGTRTYAGYLYGTTNALTVTNHAAPPGGNSPYTNILRAVQE